VVACTGKFAGSALPARLLGMSWRESRTVGLLMKVRGLTGIIILQPDYQTIRKDKAAP
jgi:Kef-type K+ transport system membrane component KefB